jgi:hypothetical protein
MARFGRGDCSAFLPQGETRSCPEIAHIQLFRHQFEVRSDRIIHIRRKIGEGLEPDGIVVLVE